MAGFIDPMSGMWIEEPEIGPVGQWTPPPPPPPPFNPWANAKYVSGSQYQGGPGSTYDSATQTGGAQQIGPQQFDWNALYQMDQVLAGYFQQAMSELGIDVVNSPFGQQLMQMFTSGQGFDEQTLAAMKTQAAETQAGATENAVNAVAARNRATGFGHSAAGNYAQGQVRQQGAQNLQRNLLGIDTANQQMGLQRQGMAGGLLGGLHNTQAGLASQRANMWANRQAQMYPSNFVPGQNPQDQQMQDLFNPGGGNTNWFM